MACPYFMPSQKSDDIAWLHPARLPLGAGWKGHCTAPGHEGEIPAADEVREACNLGYARRCPRRPQQAAWDSVRFGVTRESDQRIILTYVCERNHRPAEHGTLEYDATLSRWTAVHNNACVQKMADCYLQTYLLRKAGLSAPHES